MAVISRTGSNGIDIEVSKHHTVSVWNFQSIEVSTDAIYPLNFPYSDFNNLFLNIICSFSLYELDL